MEQTQDNLLCRCDLRRSMDDTVWVPMASTNDRQRLIEHDAGIGAIRQVVNHSLWEGAFLVLLLTARGTRSREHFDRTGPQTDDKNVTETEATNRPPPFRCWRPFNLQRAGQLLTRCLRVRVFVSRLHQNQCANGSVFVFGRAPNNNSRIQLAEAFPARFCLSSK